MSLSPQPFSLRQLQYAVAVAETLSFRKAAERCHVSQPSLSTQLALLEGALGVQLFERDHKRVLLTVSGHEILDRARVVLREVDDLVEVARRSSDPLSGTMRIGVIPTISPYLVPKIRPALRRAYPDLTVMWVEDKTSALVDKLEAGEIDGALLAVEAEIGDVEREVVLRDPFVLATPPGHPLGERTTPARPSELRDENVLLLDDGHCFRDQALAVCSQAKANELEFRATSLPTLAQMVADGAGVTLLPELSVSTESKRAELAIRPFADPAPGRTIAVVWRRRSPLGVALRQIAETARGAATGAEPSRSTVSRAKRKRR